MIKKSYSFMIITFLVMFTLSIKSVNALSPSSAIVFKDGRSQSVSMSYGSYADIAIKYFGIGQFTSSLEKVSIYIEPTAQETNYKYFSGWFTFYTTSGSSPVVPIVNFNNNNCSVEHSITGSQNMIAFTCPMAGGWLDILNLSQDTYTIYISNNLGLSDYIDNSSILNSINTSINNQSTQQHQDAQDIKNNTKETNDLIKNDNIDSASSSANIWNSKNASNGVITQLLTLPITLLNAIVSGIQTSCSSFNLGNLFGTDIVFPCINLSNLIGSTLFTTIDLLISGFMIYNISKKLIKIFNDFTNLKSNQIDEIYGGGNN